MPPASNTVRKPSLVRDLMRMTDETVHVEHHMDEALARMRRHDLSFLPVVDGDEIVGIVSAHEVQRRSSNPENPFAGENPTIKDYLIGEVSFCYDDDELETAIKAMIDTGHGNLIVADRDNQLVGQITLEMITDHPWSPKLRDLIIHANKLVDRQTATTGRARTGESGKPPVYAAKPHIKTR